MRGALATVSVVAATAASLACAAPAAALAPASFFGLNVQPLVKLPIVPPADWPRFSRRMSADGLRLARGDAMWRHSEPNPPSAAGQHTYVWDVPGQPTQSLDRIVELFALQGIEYVPVISTPPAWARGPGTAVTPARYADLAAFAGALAARYGSRGSFWTEHPQVPFVPVTRYEFWTEGNSRHFWTGAPNPAEYVSALRMASPAIRAADPAGAVLASIGWQDFENYTRALYANGIKGLVHGIGFHPYAVHAPAIMDLVVRMRRVLTAAGDATLPIDLTETGQPAATSAPGARRAQYGAVSDAARAATQSFTGDVLARSDCGVRDFLVYGVVGSGKPSPYEEPVEPYMGLYDLQANPNATGTALSAASWRWRARIEDGLMVCSAAATPPAKLLGLELAARPEPHSCISSRTTYGGNPLEGAVVTIRTSAGRTRGTQTDAFGSASFCLLDDELAGTFTLRSAISDMATSVTAACQSADRSCPLPLSPPVPGGCQICRPPPLPVAAPAPPRVDQAPRMGKPVRCVRTIAAHVVRVTQRRIIVRARLRCGRANLAGRIRVYLQRRGAGRRRYVRAVVLESRATRFTLRLRPRRGDRIILVRRPAANGTAISRSLVVSRRMLGRK